MRAELVSDHTVRTITVAVKDGPIVDVTRPWQRGERRIKVSGLEVKINPKGDKIMRVLGNLVRKDGSVGIPAESVTYSADGRIPTTRPIATAPAMLYSIFVQADAGFTVWSEPSDSAPKSQCSGSISGLCLQATEGSRRCDSYDKCVTAPGS